METYSFLRELADSWALLALFAFFIGVVLWAFRPGSTKTYADVAEIPFRPDDRPAVSDEDAPARKEEART